MDLAWNKLHGAAAAGLFAALARGPAIHTLDLSYNCVGSTLGGTDSAVPALTKYLEHNTSLTHVDISHNGITRQQAVEFAARLEKNHTILGLHVHGARTPFSHVTPRV